MMKQFFAILLVAVLALSGTAALAGSYRHEDIAFDYDENAFEIAMDNHTDDEDLVILAGKDEAWGDTFVRIHLRDLDDGEQFPTLESFAEIEKGMNTKVEQMETWAGFKDVFYYEFEVDDHHEAVFIAPIYDDDGEIDDILTVTIGVTQLEDEEVGMTRDDAISDVVDSLKVED